MEADYDAADRMMAEQHHERLRHEERQAELFRKAMQSGAWNEADARFACWFDGLDYRLVDPHYAPTRRAA